MSDLERGLSGSDASAVNEGDAMANSSGVVKKGFEGVIGQLTCLSQLACPSCESRIDLSDIPPFQKLSCGECGARFLAVAMLGKRFILHEMLNETRALCTFDSEDLENDFKAILKVFDNNMITDRAAFLAELKKLKGDLFFAGGAVARIVSVGELDGSVFACRGITSDSLYERLERVGRLSLPEALRVVREVASAYYSVAAKGILPALISPGNVLYNEKDELQISDIGIAEVLYKQAGSQKEMLADFFQLKYSSPGLLDSGQISLKGTIYSLGVLAYELISGNFPYSAKNTVELRKQQGVPCVSLMAAVPGLPHGVSGLISEMMAIDPASRTSSFIKIVERIDQIVAEHELYPTTEDVVPVAQFVPVEGVVTEPVVAQYEAPTPERSVNKKPKKSGSKKNGVKIHASSGRANHVAKARPRPANKSMAPLIIFIFFILIVAGVFVTVGDFSATPPPKPTGQDQIIDNTKTEPVKTVKRIVKTPRKKKKKVKEVVEPEETPAVVEVEKKPLTLAEREALRKSIRPANMDFDSMRAKLYQYRDAFPEGQRDAEVRRYDILTSLKKDLSSQLTPYGEQGLYKGYFYPRVGKPFLGALKSITEEKGFDILTNKGKEVTLKWEDVEFQQYADFITFLACNEAASFTLERYEERDFSNIAGTYLKLAVLYDWYDLKKEALVARGKAMKLDPSLESKLNLLLPIQE